MLTKTYSIPQFSLKQSKLLKNSFTHFYHHNENYSIAATTMNRKRYRIHSGEMFE